MRETVKFWIAISAVIYLFDLAFYTIYFAPLMITGILLGARPELFAFALIGFSAETLRTFMKLTKTGKASELDRIVKSVWVSATSAKTAMMTGFRCIVPHRTFLL